MQKSVAMADTITLNEHFCASEKTVVESLLSVSVYDNLLSFEKIFKAICAVAS